MGQQKGNPIPSYQNQGYEALRPNTNARENRDMGKKPVFVDDTVRPAEGILSWAAFSDTTTQSASLANTAYSMKLNSIDGANGFVIENDSNGFPTRIKALRTGVYNLQFSAQIENIANTNIDVDIWLAYTGSNVERSAGRVSLTKISGEFDNQISSWNYIVPIQEMDYVELKWSSQATTARLFYSGSNGIHPETPSVSATITQVG